MEPYYGGSHRAFLDGWKAHSRHTWTVLGLPAYKWKWRMRHAAMTLAEESSHGNKHHDLIFCSDMLDLAQFRGLAAEEVRSLPALAYFHENQLTYPAILPKERDYHFAMTNLTTALAAEAVWFNSEFHRQTFLDEMRRFLGRMPDFRSLEGVEAIRRRSRVHPPGIDPMPSREAVRPDGPMRLLWAARWEHDKNPADFFEAMLQLKQAHVPFRLSVLGERFEESPPVFGRAFERLHDCIDHWGFLESREEYRRVLGQADVVISTAHHEFFGISVVEAIAAGAFPLLPRRLAYPEILGNHGTEEHFYDGTVAELVQKLRNLSARLDAAGSVWEEQPGRLVDRMRRYTWPTLAPDLDDRLEKMLACR